MYYSYMDQYAAADAVAGLAGVSMVSSLIALALSILLIVALWKVYKKAGEHGWACIVPFYNGFCFYRMAWGNGWMFLVPLISSVVIAIACVIMMLGIIVGNPVMTFGMFIILVAAIIVDLVISIRATHKLSKAFGYGVGFTLGLLFLPYIFYPILGFGSAKYIKTNTLVNV